MAEQQRHALVVEDDEFLLAALEQVLGLEGYTVSVARDADEALRSLTAHRPDVLLTDFALPGVDGCDLVLRARELVPRLPAIVMTGSPHARARIRACRAIYLRKPFGLNELLASISVSIDSAPERGE